MGETNNSEKGNTIRRVDEVGEIPVFPGEELTDLGFSLGELSESLGQKDRSSLPLSLTDQLIAVRLKRMISEGVSESRKRLEYERESGIADLALRRLNRAIRTGDDS